MKMNLFLDFDGTILDVSKRFYWVYQDILSAEKHNPLGEEEYLSLIRSGWKTKEILSETYDPNFIKFFHKERIRRIESKEYLEMDKLIYSDVKNLLSRIRENNQIYLITLRNNQENLSEQLKKFRLDKSFDGIFTGNMFGDYTEKTKLIRGEIKYTSRKDMIVGDTETDIRCGKEMGVRTVGVLSGLRNKQFIEAERPDIIIRDVSKLEEVL